MIEFAANVHIGTRIISNKMVMVVTGVVDGAWIGYSEYQYEKYGVKKETMYLDFKMLQNPHYNKNIKILPSKEQS